MRYLLKLEELTKKTDLGDELKKEVEELQSLWGEIFRIMKTFGEEGWVTKSIKTRKHGRTILKMSKAIESRMERIKDSVELSIYKAQLAQLTPLTIEASMFKFDDAVEHGS